MAMSDIKYNVGNFSVKDKTNRRSSSKLMFFTLTVNECADSNLNECDTNAVCNDTLLSYNCTCKSGFHDVFGNGTLCEGKQTNHSLPAETLWTPSK